MSIAAIRRSYLQRMKALNIKPKDVYTEAGVSPGAFSRWASGDMHSDKIIIACNKVIRVREKWINKMLEL